MKTIGKMRRSRLMSICLSACLLSAAAGSSAFASGDDYWRYTVTYDDTNWKSAAETTENNVAIDGTPIISGLTNANTYFDVTNETVGSISDDPSLQTKVFKTKLDSTATSVTEITGSAISIADKSAAEADGVISYSFDFKPLDHINKQNYRVLTVRFGAADPLYQYALIVQGLVSSQTQGGKTAVGIGLGNADNSFGYAASVTTGKTNDWSPCGVWYRYYVTIDKNTKTVTVGVKNADTDTIIGEQVFTDVPDTQLSNFSSTTPVYASVRNDGASFEFRNSDKITYTVSDAAASLFDASTNTSCTDSYLKLTAKADYADSTDASRQNYLAITSGGNRRCVTSGVFDYSMLFKVNKRTDAVSNKLLMSARMGNSVTWNYALKVTGLSDSQRSNAINIGLGSVDGDDGNMQTGCNNWTTADAWYKYHININYYTNTVTVGVTNMSTGAEVFTPYTAAFDPATYASLATTVTTSVCRYGADYAIDDVTESRDIFVYKDGNITVGDTAVTASVQLANDVHYNAYNPAYNGTGHEPILILAAYDKDGRLISVNSAKQTIDRTKGESDNLTWTSVSTSVNKTADYSAAKAFLWKSLDDITPFCEILCEAPAAE